MRAIRRALQVVALVGTLLVGVVALALIVSQTPWFRDWLRRYVVRESKQYLNGELSIGRLGGNLFFGFNLSDVAVDVSGQRVIAIKALDVDYSVFQLISQGIVLDGIKLTEPRLYIERNGEGWNLGGLVKRQRQEADREGPGRPISLPSIDIADGSLVIDDGVGSRGYRLPERIDDLDVKASFEYAPVHYTVGLDHVSFRGSSPGVALEQLTGRISVRDDNVYIDDLVVQSTDSALSADGVIEQYLKNPVLKVTSTASVSLPEIARVLPAVEGYHLHPKLEVKASGPADRLRLDLEVKSEAGDVRGQVTADVKAPGLGLEGNVRVSQLDLAPILRSPTQRTNLTGNARVDLRLASAPAGAPALDRMSGTFEFRGPRVVAAGYEATNVAVRGAMQGARIELDGRGRAYGGTATAIGFVVVPGQRRPLSFDLRGEADGVDLRQLPAATRAPDLATDLSLSAYHVRGIGRSFEGSATLRQSEIEGATLAEGTVAEFHAEHGVVSYAARGTVSGLDLQRVGRALHVAALERPELEGGINGQFDVAGAGTSIETLTLDATGTLNDSTLAGARFPWLSFETHVQEGAISAKVKGGFEGLDPSRFAGREALAGRVTGTVDASVAIADLREPITPDAIEGGGQLTLDPSTVGGLDIDRARVRGQYRSGVADIAELELRGPDLTLTSTGRLTLDRASTSSLKYHVEATNLAALGKLAGREGMSGAAILDGTVTGNAATLQSTGTLDGSGLGYQNNQALDLNTRYTVTVPDLAFANARVESTTSATFVEAGGLRIDQIDATTTYAQKTLDFTTSIKERARELDAAGRLIFHPDHQEVHLPRLTVRTQGIEWRTAPGTEAALEYGRGRISVENAHLVSGDQSLEVSGTLALKSEEPAGTLQIEARNVDLAQVEQLALQNRGLSGRLTASARVAGTADRPIVDGRVEIADGGFQGYRYESLTGDIDYRNDRIEVDATLRQSTAESITATGSVPTSLFRRSEEGGHVAPGGEADRVDMRIKSTSLGLGLIQGFTTQVTNVSGTVEADVHLTGSGQDPHLEGYIEIRNGAFGVPVGGTSYTGLDTRIDLQPDIVRIGQFQIRDEHGELMTISGQLAVHERQVGAVDVSIESDNFEIVDNALGDVGIDSQLKITGELRRPRVVGEVRLEAARVEVDQVLQLFYDPYSVEALPDVVSAERQVEGTGSAADATRQALERAARTGAAPAGEPQPAAGEAAAPAGAFSPVALDVRLRIPDNLVLRGNDLRPGGPTGAALGDLNITVGGDLQIRKDAGGPVTLVGTVNTVRGTYEFQGRRFELARNGTVRFTGERQLNPLLDIAASREIPDTGVTARIQITGTVRTPELHLSSTPPLEESDILALIVFNRPVNELGTGERASLAATAGGIATGFLAAPLGESIGRALDLDLFEISTSTDSGEFGAGITVGQQIGDRVFFKLRQEFGDHPASEFLVEYQLADFLRVQATAAPETSGSANRVGQRRIERAGIDLIFLFSY